MVEGSRRYRRNTDKRVRAKMSAFEAISETDALDSYVLSRTLSTAMTSIKRIQRKLCFNLKNRKKGKSPTVKEALMRLDTGAMLTRISLQRAFPKRASTPRFRNGVCKGPTPTTRTLTKSKVVNIDRNLFLKELRRVIIILRHLLSPTPRKPERLKLF